MHTLSLFGIDTIVCEQSLQNPEVVIPAGLMTPGQMYTWTLTATTSDGKQSSSAYSERPAHMMLALAFQAIVSCIPRLNCLVAHLLCCFGMDPVRDSRLLVSALVL
eukprot:scaffold3148_cov36-Prasinocladus_malaysianus.AAC.2